MQVNAGSKVILRECNGYVEPGERGNLLNYLISPMALRAHGLGQRMLTADADNS